MSQQAEDLSLGGENSISKNAHSIHTQFHYLQLLPDTRDLRGGKVSRQVGCGVARGTESRGEGEENNNLI